MDDIWAGRQRAIGAELERLGLDGLVVSSLVNIRYLTGFEGSAGLLVLTRERAWLLVDGRYETVTRAAQLAGSVAAGLEIERIRKYDPGVIELVQRLGLRTIGVEADHLTLSAFGRWEAGWGPGVTLTRTSALVERQRLIKGAGELAILRRAARALSDVALSLADLVRPGQTERQVAAGIDQRIRTAGFSRPAFDTIVAAGPNGAYPHARPTDRAIGRGELVVLDFGGVLDGYCVDLTRSASIGPVGADGQALYRAVREAQDAAILWIRPGVAGADVDRAARDVIHSHGLADRFVHGTGHGLGLEVHEGPTLSPGEPGSGDRLDAGMVVTVEPGVYVPGLGGVRLEDDVLVTAEGCEVLTTAPRDILVV